MSAVQELDVYYNGWGESWKLGQVADDGRHLVFEYDSEAIKRGLELSPLHLKLRYGGYGGFPVYLSRLPGLLYDALPDGWGMLLLDRFFRQQGIRNPGPLDRLTFIGSRALGALSFVPSRHVPLPEWNLQVLYDHSQQVLTDDAQIVLEALAGIGGSPQGARPKALVRYDMETNKVSTSDEARGKSWLVKFPAQGEASEACAIECLYMDLARACGIEVPHTNLFELTKGSTAFGVQRFDRVETVQGEEFRVQVHSLAGLLHIDFRVPGATDYVSLLRATRLITRDEREVEKAYARAVFNVVYHNRDDHPKNFAWVLGNTGQWRLSPAFDLTFSEGPGGQHSMDICGRGEGVTQMDMMQLAAQCGVPKTAAQVWLDRILNQTSQFRQMTSNFPIRSKTVAEIEKAIGKNCAALRSA